MNFLQLPAEPLQAVVGGVTDKTPYYAQVRQVFLPHVDSVVYDQGHAFVTHNAVEVLVMAALILSPAQDTACKNARRGSA